MHTNLKTPRKKMPELVTSELVTSELVTSELVTSELRSSVEQIMNYEMREKNRCMSRVTYDNIAQHFGNGRNKFYIEFRCIYPCYKNMDTCVKCLQKSQEYKKQDSQRFDHGKINEPITDNSHIYDGKWYRENVKKWGEPPSEIIEFAIEHQKEARRDFVTMKSLSKVDDQTTSAEDNMPRAKKSVSASNPLSISLSILSDEHQTSIEVESKKVRKLRKPLLVSSTDDVSEEKLIKKRTRKPKPSLEIINPEETNSLSPSPSSSSLSSNSSSSSKKRVSPKKKEGSLYESLITIDPVIYKEVTLPTHMEKTMELFDMDQYEIEYVKVQLCTIGNIAYFKDSKKNKVYKKIKEKTIGDYVGRYDPYTDSIVTDIPDSDDESE